MDATITLRRMQTILAIIGVQWIVLFISFIVPMINSFGIRPRTISGLPGVVFMPMLHGSIAHLAANTVSLLVLGFVLAMTEKRSYAVVIAFITVVSGLAVWLFARSTTHIGASGVIYGLAGFLVARAFFLRDWKSIAISLAVLLVYGGMVWGVLPRKAGISWEAHLFGMASGVAAAYMRAKFGDRF